MEYNVYLTAHARDDLKSIYEFIAYELLVPESAAHITKGILDTAKSLNTFPTRNPFYHEEPWKSMEVQFIPFKNYIIFCKINSNQTVAVSRIMYDGRDLRNQLEEDNFS